VRLNQDQDVLEEKLQRAQARILDLEKEKSALQVSLNQKA
jgi:hypothetical protein